MKEITGKKFGLHFHDNIYGGNFFKLILLGKRTFSKKEIFSRDFSKKVSVILKNLILRKNNITKILEEASMFWK